jgi:phosphoserine phosphatase
MTTRVILVRHGQSSYNAQNRIQGRINESVLTELGTEMAINVGQALVGLPIDAFYSSPLQRAYRTAEIIRDQLVQANGPTNIPAIETSDDLLEIDLPLWAGMTKDAVKAQYPDQQRLWKSHPEAFFMEITDADGQPHKHYPVLALFDQARSFWQRALSDHADKTLLIVGHNGILRSLLSTAIGLQPSQYQLLRQSNCCINVLNFSGGLGDPVQIESLNVTAHLGEPLPSQPQKGKRLLLVRHGETEWNRMQKFQGQIDVPLNDNGHAQARAAGEFLKDVAIDYAVSSPLARPRQTAEGILAHHPGVEMRFLPGLKEIGHGLWEGKLEPEIAAEYGPELQAWKTKPETVQMPEGENLQEVWDRAVADWQSIVEAAPDGSTGLVVAHDAVNKVILCHILGLQPKDIWAVKQGNGAVSVIDYVDGPNGAVTVQALNITSHLGGVLDKTAAGAL